MPSPGRLDPDLAQQAIEYCYQQNWSDGLPLVPVSQPLLDRFLAQTGRGPQEIIGSLEATGRGQERGDLHGRPRLRALVRYRGRHRDAGGLADHGNVVRIPS